MGTNETEKPFPIITERFAVDQKSYDKIWDMTVNNITSWSWGALRIEVGLDTFEIQSQDGDEYSTLFWYAPLPGRQTKFTLKELVDMFNLLAETTRLRIDLVVG